MISNKIEMRYILNFIEDLNHSYLQVRNTTCVTTIMQTLPSSLNIFPRSLPLVRLQSATRG